MMKNSNTTLSTMIKHFILFLSIMLVAMGASGQKQFITALENNTKQYKPQYAEVTNAPTFSENMYQDIKVSDEKYELSPNAISYYNAICALKESTKLNILKAHSEIKYVACTQGLSDYPEELLWLPFAISALDQYYSKDGNYGIWGLQYIYAIKYGAYISNCTDERQDIKIATRAAIEQLKYNKEKFGTWYYALAAYLYGAPNLKRIQAQNNDNHDIYKLLDSNNNVFDIWCAFISWGKNFENMQQNITVIPQDYDTVSIHDRMHIGQISAVMGIKLDELKSLNSSFHCEVIDGRHTPVTFKLPNGKKNDFKNLRDSIIAYKDSIYFPKPKAPEEPKEYSPDPDQYGKITYTIQTGDCLSKIAQKYHVNVDDIQKWNNLSGTNISVGKTLIIWTKKSNSTTGQQTNNSANQRSSGTTNQQNSGTAGQPSGYQLYETYTIKAGDSPYSIAKRYEWATADDILKWNNISNPSKLQIGQKLKIYKKK